VVDAFVKGLRANPFSNSLLRDRAMSVTEVQERAYVYIATKDAIREKKSNERHGEVTYTERA